MATGLSSIPGRYDDNPAQQFGAGSPPRSSDTSPPPSNGSTSTSDTGERGNGRPLLPLDGFISQKAAYEYLAVSRTSFRTLRDEGWVKTYASAAFPKKVMLDAQEFRSDAQNIMSGGDTPPHQPVAKDG